MGKLGTKRTPIRVRVKTESRMAEVAEICEKNNWIYICGIEPDQVEDITDLEYMLNPQLFEGKRPKKKQAENTTYVRSEPTVGRNDPCPCGSGKKYKRCCMN